MKLKIVKLNIDVELYSSLRNVFDIAAANPPTKSRVNEATRKRLVEIEADAKSILEEFGFVYEDKNDKLKSNIHETQDGISSYSYYILKREGEEIIRVVLQVRVSNHGAKDVKDSNERREKQVQDKVEELQWKDAESEVLDVYFKPHSKGEKIYISMSGESTYTEVFNNTQFRSALRGKIVKMLSKHPELQEKDNTEDTSKGEDTDG